MLRFPFKHLKSLSASSLARWLRNPWTIAVSAGLGVYLGMSYPQTAALISPIGKVYLGLLKMCVLPILISAIMVSVGRLVKGDNSGQAIRRILVVFPLGLLLTSSIAVIIAAIAQPGKNLSASALEKLGVLINQSGIDLEIALTGGETKPPINPIDQFLANLVPDNIFSALSEGQTLQVLFFSIIFGIALGLVREPITHSLFSFLEGIYYTCNRLIQGLTLLLPIGLFSLLSAQISRLGLSILVPMLRFVLVAILTFSIIYILSTLLIWRQANRASQKGNSNRSLATVLSEMREPTFLALATTSSLACIPSAISTLTTGLNFDRQTVQLVTPLSITLCRFGSVTYFALASLFVAQLYNKDLSHEQLVTVIILAILAGMATSGATGVVTLAMLDIVLNPLKLPLEAVLVLFLAIDPLLDPFRTLGIVHTGIAATALIAHPGLQAVPIAPAEQSLPDSTV